jgi:hypothetical protein
VRSRIAWAVAPLLVAGSLGLARPVASQEAVRCYSAEDVFPSAETRLRGDVDGDGHDDGVRTRARWLDAETCRAWLTLSIPRQGVRERAIDPLTGILIAPPGLAGLIRLDRRPGLEVAVVTWVGASTGFVELYGYRRGRIVPLAREAFAYAGSVVHRDGVDCARTHGALLVRSRAEFDLDDERYHVQRRFYGLRDGVLRPLPDLTEHYRVRMPGLRRFPGLWNQVPFPSCTEVPGAS